MEQHKRRLSNFDVGTVAGMDEKDIEGYKKIRATIENAKELKIIENQYGSFENYMSSFNNEEDLIDDLTERVHYVGKQSVRRILKSIRKECS